MEPLRQRRRQPPLNIKPRAPRPDDKIPSPNVSSPDSPSPSGTGASSPDSPKSTGFPSSADSPSPTKSSFQPPAQTSAQVTAAASISASSSAEPPPLSTISSAVASSSVPPPPPATSSQSPPPPPPPPQPSTQPSSSSPAPALPPSSSSSASSISASAPLQGQASLPPPAVLSSKSNPPPPQAAPSTLSSQIVTASSSAPPALSENAGSAGVAFVTVASSIAGAAVTTTQPHALAQPIGTQHAIAANAGATRSSMSPAVRGTLIALCVLGGIALAILAFICIRKRKGKSSYAPSTTKQWDPDYGATAPTASYDQPPTLYRDTRSTNTTALYAPDSNERPTTVSTSPPTRIERPPSIAPPLPSANPFNRISPLNKAYDMLRGRPRSTTLSRTAEWSRNPFTDPSSRRYDPFGDIHEVKEKDSR